MNISGHAYDLYSSDNHKLISSINKLVDNEDFPKIRLRQKDFDKGTYRIRTPGIYWLSEDIEFSPNSNIYSNSDCETFPNVLDNFHPEPGQMNEYPTPPYQFGFFAAITIECDDVIINLNQYTIQQSRIHYFHQRFYSNIELNKSPFLSHQGPSSFGDPGFPKNICIRNGTIGLSSHHGIHGNGNTNILLEDLIINQFEVAGIAINGGKNVVCRHIEIRDSSRDVQVNFLYSNAIYTRRFLLDLYKQVPDAFLDIGGDDSTRKDIKTIICELQTEMIKNVYMSIINGEKVKSSLFHNTSCLPEGNIYGMVFNKIGVVVGDFIKTHEINDENKDIMVHDILFKNLDSFPREIISITSIDGPVVGSVGNVIPILQCVDDTGTFVPNKQTVATVILGKYLNLGKLKIHSKSLSIPESICNWCESKSILDNVMEDKLLKFVDKRDQMNHFMKGNIIMFISGATDIRVANIKMTNINNSGPECDCGPKRMEDYKYIYETPGWINYNLSEVVYKGQNLNPFLITGSSNVNIRDVLCRLFGKNKDCNGISVLGDSNHINCRNIIISCDNEIPPGHNFHPRKEWCGACNNWIRS